MKAAPASVPNDRFVSDDDSLKSLKLSLIEAVVAAQDEAAMRLAIDKVLGSASLKSAVKLAAKVRPRAPLPIPVRSVTPVKSVPLNILGGGGDADGGAALEIATATAAASASAAATATATTTTTTCQAGAVEEEVVDTRRSHSPITGLGSSGREPAPLRPGKRVFEVEDHFGGTGAQMKKSGSAGKRRGRRHSVELDHLKNAELERARCSSPPPAGLVGAGKGRKHSVVIDHIGIGEIPKIDEEAAARGGRVHIAERDNIRDGNLPQPTRGRMHIAETDHIRDGNDEGEEKRRGRKHAVETDHIRDTNAQETEKPRGRKYLGEVDHLKGNVSQVRDKGLEARIARFRKFPPPGGPSSFSFGDAETSYSTSSSDNAARTSAASSREVGGADHVHLEVAPLAKITKHLPPPSSMVPSARAGHAGGGSDSIVFG